MLRLPGHYKAGFNWDTSNYRDNYFDVNGGARALTGLSAMKHDGRAQVWVLADQMICRHGPGDNDGLILIGSYAHDQPDTAVFDHFFWAGLIDRGFWAERPNDQINFGVAYYIVSDKLRATQMIEQSLGLPLSGAIRATPILNRPGRRTVLAQALETGA